MIKTQCLTFASIGPMCIALIDKLQFYLLKVMLKNSAWKMVDGFTRMKAESGPIIKLAAE